MGSADGAGARVGSASGAGRRVGSAAGGRGSRAGSAAGSGARVGSADGAGGSVGSRRLRPNRPGAVRASAAGDGTPRGGDTRRCGCEVSRRSGAAGGAGPSAGLPGSRAAGARTAGIGAGRATFGAEPLASGGTSASSPRSRERRCRAGSTTVARTTAMTTAASAIAPSVTTLGPEEPPAPWPPEPSEADAVAGSVPDDSSAPLRESCEYASNS